MRRFRTEDGFLLAGVVAGAVLMALAITMVSALKTGILGALLVVLIMLTSVCLGWLVGCSCQLRRVRKRAYDRGYRDAMDVMIVEEVFKADMSKAMGGKRTWIRGVIK